MTKRLTAVRDAYAVLKDEKSRAKYDETLGITAPNSESTARPSSRIIGGTPNRHQGVDQYKTLQVPYRAQPPTLKHGVG